MRKEIDDFKAKFSNDRNLSFIAEPGRYYVTRTTTVASIIHSRKGGKGNTQALYLDNGIYGSFNGVKYDDCRPVAIKLTSALDSNKEPNEKIPTAVFGPTCDGADMMCKSSENLLERAEIGEWLIFKDMGAYSDTASFAFNGITHKPVRLYCI